MTTVTVNVKAADGSTFPIQVSLPSVTPKNVSKFAYGVHLSSQTGGAFDATLLPAYQTWLGQQIPLCMVFGTRGTFAEFTAPNYTIDPVTAAGKTVIISNEIILSNGQETYAMAANPNSVMSTGETITVRQTAFGANLVAHGQANAIIRLCTEVNNESSGNPNIYWPTNIVADFIQAYRTSAKILKAVPGNNFKITWSTSPDAGNSHDYTDSYPGDDVVDIVDIDDYATVTPWGSNWTDPQDEWNARMAGSGGGAGLGIQHYIDFANAHGKPIGWSEWGQGAEYGNNGMQQVPADAFPLFVTNMRGVFDSTNTVYAASWEDADSGYWSPPSPDPNTEAAFIAAFGGIPSATWPLGSTPVTPPPVTPPTSLVVTGISGKAIGNGQVTVSWTPPAASPSISYTISRNGVEVGGGAKNWEGPLPGPASSVTFNNLAPKTSYTFAIQPVGGMATSVTVTTTT